MCTRIQGPVARRSRAVRKIPDSPTRALYLTYSNFRVRDKASPLEALGQVSSALGTALLVQSPRRPACVCSAPGSSQHYSAQQRSASLASPTQAAGNPWQSPVLSDQGELRAGWGPLSAESPNPRLFETTSALGPPPGSPASPIWAKFFICL